MKVLMLRDPRRLSQSDVVYLSSSYLTLGVNAQDSSSSEVVSIPSPGDTVGPSLPVIIHVSIL